MHAKEPIQKWLNVLLATIKEEETNEAINTYRNTLKTEGNEKNS